MWLHVALCDVAYQKMETALSGVPRSTDSQTSWKVVLL